MSLSLFLLWLIGTQSAIFPCHIALTSVAYGSATLFILFQKRHDLRTNLLNAECVFRFSLQLCKKNISF